jgi:hypothetical protein
MRRILVACGMTAVLAVATPPSALAANVSADCGSAGGAFYTHGTADNWQDHTHDGLLWHVWYYGRQYKTHGWGFEIGLETGTVNGPNLFAPGARCIT